MRPIAFASSNSEKFATAKYICEKEGIPIEQVFVDIDEIQGENPELIIKDKARRAFETYGKPVIVSDDSWDIPALNGFPGAYMKSMNDWFTPDDFLRLLNGITDRRAILHQYLAYVDETQTIVFSGDLQGTILEEARGEFIPHKAWMSVIAMNGDNGQSLSEVFGSGKQLEKGRHDNRPETWHEVVKWYKESHE